MTDSHTPPRFTRAIVRKPGRSLVHGITTADLGVPDYDLALRQHAAYVDALRKCGLAITELPALEEFPDSTFVEDVALCTRVGAVVTNPGAASRNGERAHIRAALEEHFATMGEIAAPGTLDAGDVMMVGDHFYIGLSARTNADGAAQLITILRAWGMDGEAVPLQEVLHLKTGVTYMERGNMLVSGEFVHREVFAKFHRAVVPAIEAYAANCLWINDRILIPDGFPQVAAALASLGYDLIPLDMSEYQKIDGGLSCLSLRF
ncbi:MAG: arginine deiminase family protein [Bacteroidia bacterium]